MVLIFFIKFDTQFKISFIKIHLQWIYEILLKSILLLVHSTTNNIIIALINFLSSYKMLLSKVKSQVKQRKSISHNNRNKTVVKYPLLITFIFLNLIDVHTNQPMKLCVEDCKTCHYYIVHLPWSRQYFKRKPRDFAALK